jgi:hypothetical protein
LANPILQPLDRLIVPLGDFGFDVGVIISGDQPVRRECK